MSGGNAQVVNSDLLLEDTAVAIVAASWHAEITSALIEAAERRLTAAGVEVEIYRVPGSFELPLGCQWAIDADFDAVVALGVVIRGGTPHFEYVCNAATNGILQLQLQSGVPIGFGLLTCDDEAQARDRAGLPGSRQDKGTEAAEAVLAMLLLANELTSD